MLFISDFILQPTPALTYRTIGGIFDFYIFTGPSPDAVVQQYLAVIGQPVMVPYWSLGFHLCRYNYSTSAELNKVVTRMRAGNFPYVRAGVLFTFASLMLTHWPLGDLKKF